MAKNETRRLRPAQLAADRDAFDALQGITNYAPANAAYTVTNIKALRDRVDLAWGGGETGHGELHPIDAEGRWRDNAAVGPG